MDGVLCTIRAHLGQGSPGPGMSALDREGVGLLNKLIDNNTYFVLSSSWRKLYSKEEMETHLKSYGWEGKFHDDWKTINLNSGHRGTEINEWMYRNPGVERYLILDDDSDFDDNQFPSFVQTNSMDGISYNNFNDAIKILFETDAEWHTLYETKKTTEKTSLKAAFIFGNDVFYD
jgi:hypothetical protein